MRYQHPVKHAKPRRRLSPRVIKEIDYEVNRIARKHGVSKSWVVSLVLADAFGITKQERFDVK